MYYKRDVPFTKSKYYWSSEHIVIYSSDLESGQCFWNALTILIFRWSFNLGTLIDPKPWIFQYPKWKIFKFSCNSIYDFQFIIRLLKMVKKLHCFEYFMLTFLLFGLQKWDSTKFNSTLHQELIYAIRYLLKASLQPFPQNLDIIKSWGEAGRRK